jgi:hypothetical protein
MKTNLTKKTIELTKTEMKNAMTYGTTEYDALQAMRRDYPGFEVVEAVKVKKTAKTPLDSLNLATIKAYVKANGSPEQKQKFLTISNATITEEGVIIPPQSFFDIKKWFLAEFPQYKAALEAHDAEIVRIFDAVDAKIAEAQKRIAEEVRAKAEADARSFLEIA